MEACFFWLHSSPESIYNQLIAKLPWNPFYSNDSQLASFLYQIHPSLL